MSNFQRGLFNGSSRTAKADLCGSFHDLHTIARTEINKLEVENARLRETLRYYAETNYEVHIGYDDSIDLPDICFERGRRARQALEADE